MAINLFCKTCKSSMKLNGSRKSICSKCGSVLTGKKYRVRVKLTPSSKWKSSIVSSLAEAKKLERQYAAIRDCSVDTLTIDEVWSHYLEWAKMNKKTWHDDDVRYKNHAKEYLEHLMMSAVAPYHVQQVINAMHKKKTPKGRPYALATIQQVLVLIKRLFNWSIKQGYYQGSNPCNTIEMPRFDNKVTNPLNRDGLKSLMTVLDSWENERAILVIKFALYSGKRRGEILKMTWANVDLENRLLTLHATNTKSKKVQSIPLNNLCMAVLHRCKELTVCDYVFPCSTGKYFSGFDNTWKRIRKKAGIPTTRFHDLRHTFASYLASSGKVDIYTLKELLGHSTIEMTQRYAHLVNGALRKAVAVADEVF